MELFVQQPKRDQKCQNFCLLLVFSIKFMKPYICKVYPAIPHGIEVEHWSVYPKVPGSNLVESWFFFLVLKNLCSNFDLYLAFLALDMVRMLKYLQISIFGAFLSWFNHRNNLWTIFPYSWHCGHSPRQSAVRVVSVTIRVPSQSCQSKVRVPSESCQSPVRVPSDS